MSLFVCCCFVCRFHVTDGQNTRDQITRGRRSKRASLRSMAVLWSRAHERRRREIPSRSARERAAKPREKLKTVAPAPISSRFFCPLSPLLLSNRNRHATQATNARDQIAFCAFHSFLVEVQTNTRSRKQ